MCERLVRTRFEETSWQREAGSHLNASQSYFHIFSSGLGCFSCLLQVLRAPSNAWQPGTEAGSHLGAKVLHLMSWLTAESRSANSFAFILLPYLFQAQNGTEGLGLWCLPAIAAASQASLEDNACDKALRSCALAASLKVSHLK